MRVLLAATCALSLGCHRTDPGPDLAIVGESTRVRLEDPYPAQTPWLVDGKVVLIAAAGEHLGLQVLHRALGPVSLTMAGADILVVGYDVASFAVTRPSTELYGGGRSGTFADGLTPARAPVSNPGYFELWVGWVAGPGVYTGELVVGDRHLPVSLTVVPVHLEAQTRVWAYEDPRQLGSSGTAPTEEEKACINTFATNGVMLTPDLPLDWFAPRRGTLGGTMHDLPVVIPDDPTTAGDAVRAWIAATTNTGFVPFAIPIDEPSTPEARAKVIALAKAVRAAGGGPATFRFAITDEPRPEYGDLIDLYISLRTPRSANGTQWAYNGAPPRAGSMVLDAATPGTRTWGWIGYRWKIPGWYVWDALYWHDRHNRKGSPPRALDVHTDPTSFDDGDDHGNLDGVLALPSARGCEQTLRLAAVNRGSQDRALLELAAACDPAATAALAEKMVPTALGDAPAKGPPSWPTDEAAWELARRELLRLAACNR